jgi:hypothetical protein
MTFGKAVKIEKKLNSIQEGFEVQNFNWHVNGTQSPVPTQMDLPQAGSGSMIG